MEGGAVAFDHCSYIRFNCVISCDKSDVKAHFYWNKMTISQEVIVIELVGFKNSVCHAKISSMRRDNVIIYAKAMISSGNLM